MFGIVRRSLVFVLAIALAVAGMPMAHAMSCASPAHPAVALHQHADVAADAQLQVQFAHHHDDVEAAAALASQDDRQPPTAPCKCLNCGLCVAGGIAPLSPDMSPERLARALTYRMSDSGGARSILFIDPGIPILAA